MAKTVRTSIVINRPIEEVWAFLDDPALEMQWRRPSLKELHKVGSSPVGPGTRFEGIVMFGPKGYPYVSQLTRYEPPNRVTWKGVRSAGWVIGSEGSYTLERENGHTKMIHEITLEPNNFAGRLVTPLVGAVGPKGVMQLLVQLKSAVETAST